MTKNIRKGLNATEANLLSLLSKEGKNIFTVAEARKLVSINRRYLENLLQRLVEKKWLTRLTRGEYLILPLEAGPEGVYGEHEYIIASRLIQPYAISYWSAIHYYGYTEQIPTTIFVTTTARTKRTEYTVLGINYKLVRVVSKKFFGVHKITINEEDVSITDKEKTLVDALDHPEYCGSIIEVCKAIANAWTEISSDKIIEYGIKIGNSAVLKRLGYLLELLQFGEEDFLNSVKLKIRSGFSLLDPSIKKKGPYSSKWNVRANLSQEELLSWKET